MRVRVELNFQLIIYNIRLQKEENSRQDFSIDDNCILKSRHSVGMKVQSSHALQLQSKKLLGLKCKLAGVADAGQTKHQRH